MTARSAFANAAPESRSVQITDTSLEALTGDLGWKEKEDHSIPYLLPAWHNQTTVYMLDSVIFTLYTPLPERLVISCVNTALSADRSRHIHIWRNDTHAFFYCTRGSDASCLTSVAAMSCVPLM
jgi:hypothetical protein